jgi:flagellar hook assembly protein FlgD
LVQTDWVDVELYNSNGMHMKTITSGKYTEGNHTVKVDAFDLPAGYYYYTFRTSNNLHTRKFAVVR